MSAERDYAPHLAKRLLNVASQALIEGCTGTIQIPQIEPGFAAVADRILQLLTDQLNQTEVSAPPRIKGKHKSPNLEDPIPAINKEK